MDTFRNIKLYYFLIPLILGVSLIFPYQILADDLEQTCLQVAEIDNPCQGKSPSDCRKMLESCADYFQQQSDKITEDLSKTAEQKKTLSSQISSLKKKVQNLVYQINQGNVIIKDLALQISDTKSSIDKITLQIEESKDQISNVLRSINEEDQKSQVEILLEGNLSDFFNNLVYLGGLNSKIRNLLKNTEDLKQYLQGQQDKMDDEKDQTEKTVKIQALQKQESESTKKQQEGLLKLTEAEYQKQLQQKQETEKKAVEIRARLFELIGVPKAPTFGEAYEIAKYVSNITGVRPALILAVITQESNLGKNVGQCYLTNKNTGVGKRIKDNTIIYRVMSPKRDVSYFLNIVSNLGRDYSVTPVSCPMSYGWGGAMGPAQFIPSTWVIYKERISSITNKPGDPWNIKDAFLAAGLYLSDYGAKSRNEDNEWRAAMVYFSGSTSTKYRFYGDSVIRLARGYEVDIAALEK